MSEPVAHDAWTELYANFLEHTLKLHPIDIVIDAGAHEGQFAKKLRQIGFTGQIHSFEPSPGPFQQCLESSLSDPNWSVYEIALGDFDGRATLNISPGTGSSFMAASEFGRRLFPDLTSANASDVRISRLDSFLSSEYKLSTQPRIFVKLDTQGHDLYVMKGLGQWNSCVQIVQAELSVIPIYENMQFIGSSLNSFNSIGYQPIGFFPVSTLKSSGRVLEFDALMLHNITGFTREEAWSL
ncbi:FkbM family methyltransferase [Kineococcus sp. GCM10028916]|uniref:FkbM family methyltransferase n=1 Tax=Kineococcus sp. GCM10028916 TaxID=3273394 RepID=UPI00362D3A51